MNTAQHSHELSLESRFIIQQKILEEIATGEQQRSYNWISVLIDEATRSGGFSIAFHLKDLPIVERNPIRRNSIISLMWRNMRTLDYKIDMTCSDNPENERVFISWTA